VSAWIFDRARGEVGEAAGVGKVLEVGIGTGATMRFYRPGVELTGIDLSKGMLEVARRNADRLGVAADLREMDAQHLDFPDRAFDAVVFSLCLCTIPDPERAIREAIRVARPGAAMVFLEHVHSNLPPVAALQWLISLVTVPLQNDHWNRRTPELVRAFGVQVRSERRWLLGVFDLLVGEAPRSD
jgi:ubiquinone/menaquinone biosynthesis C-methylase UbiE